MITKRLIALAFALHAGIGSFCSIPTANAMPVEDHMEVQSMNHMADEDCEHCDHEEHSSERTMSCDSGHCLFAHAPETSASSSVTVEMRTPVFLNALNISVSEPILDQTSWQFIADGPPPETGISTIVLKQ